MIDVEPFEHRPFGPTDRSLFEAMLAGFRGSQIATVSPTYAEGIAIELWPSATRPDGLPAVGDLWQVYSWGCDLVLTTPDGLVWDSRRGNVNEIYAHFGTLVGAELEYYRLAEDLGFVMKFDDGTTLSLAIDSDDPELDQWFVILPSGQSVGVAPGRWFFHGGSDGSAWS